LGKTRAARARALKCPRVRGESNGRGSRHARGSRLPQRRFRDPADLFLSQILLNALEDIRFIRRGDAGIYQLLTD
jgi:hypothetical protein